MYKMQTLVNAMNSPRCCHCIVKHHFGIYVLGGKMASRVINTVEMLDVSLNDGLDFDQRKDQLQNLKWKNILPMRRVR